MAIDLNAIIFDASNSTSTSGTPGNPADAIANGGAMKQEQTGAGNDLARGGGNVEQISTGAGDDRIHTADTAADGASTMSKGGDDRDYMFGGAARDKMEGGKGNDLMSGGKGNDDVDGGAGDDAIDGGQGNDTLTGGEGNDTFQFKIYNAAEHINFGEMIGNDTITDFEQGKDKIDMSSIFARMADADVDELLGKISDLVQHKSGISVAGYKGRYTGDIYSGDNATVNTGPDVNTTDHTVEYSTQVGGGILGYDESVLGATTATLSNGDTFQFTITSSSLSGHKSFIITFKNITDGVKDKGGSITVNNLSDLNTSDFIREDMKIAHGTDGADVMDYRGLGGTKGVHAYGYGGGDTMWGTNNRDTLVGGSGNDELHGGGGRDEINGGGGNDNLFGDDGSDFLYGNIGNNTLTGGAMKDFFVFGGTVDSAGHFVLDAAHTTVTDFQFGMDFIKFANMGDGYNGSLANARLEQRFDVASHLSQGGTGNKDLIVYSDGHAREYVLQNFFDGHNQFINSKGYHEAVTLDYVKAHIDQFVVWA